MNERVNSIFATISAAERAAMLAMLAPDMRLAAAYAPRAVAALTIALFAFDRALSLAVTRASEPIVGQIRLAWWRDFLVADDDAAPAVDPIARVIGNLASQTPVRSSLTALVNGWESLLAAPPIAEDALLAYADGRGHGLFSALAMLQSRQVRADAGKSWALVDFAFHCTDPDTAARALALADKHVGEASLPRPLAILDSFARRDLSRGLRRGSGAGRPSRLWDALRGALRAK